MKPLKWNPENRDPIFRIGIASILACSAGLAFVNSQVCLLMGLIYHAALENSLIRFMDSSSINVQNSCNEMRH